MEPERHWEWRVFGKLPLQLHAALAQAEQIKKKKRELVDRYLWRAGCRANIKIRKKKLKIKELVRATDDGFELWIESRTLKFRFPLEARPADLLAGHLGIPISHPEIAGCKSADALIEVLVARHPEIKVVTIQKKRTHYRLTPQGKSISLEVARIEKPLAIESFCIESEPVHGPDHEAVCLGLLRKIRDGFELPDTLRIMGYVDFLEDLAQNKLIPK